MATMVHVPRGHATRVGVIGDRRRPRMEVDITKPPEKKKKQTFMVSGAVPFELDLKYIPGRVLGNGSYGVVCSCVNQETRESVAIKKIAEAFSNHTTALGTLREIQILRQIRHDNVISLKDVMLSSSSYGKSDFQQVYLVHELMDDDLNRVIKSTKLLPYHCKLYLFQILRGLKYLHLADIIHCDVKPGNILVNENLDVKIFDFGLARTKYKDTQFMTDYVVSRWYRAPELLTGSNSYGNGIDMWSAGCVFAEMLGGKPIFPGTDSFSQIHMIHDMLGTQADLNFIGCWKAKEYIDDLPYSPGGSFERMYPEADPLAIDLLKMMLVLDPSKRFSASQALEHPYFAGLYDPIRDCSAQMKVRLEIDENPRGVDEKMIRDLIWEEMLVYHPEERSYNIF